MRRGWGAEEDTRPGIVLRAPALEPYPEFGADPVREGSSGRFPRGVARSSSPPGRSDESGVTEHAVPTAASTPLFLLGSPAVGCGTTLLSPLLDGDGGLRLHGPEVGAALLELALSPPGEEEDALTPEADEYGDLAALVAYHESDAREHGASGWGVELPGLPVEFLDLLRRALPGTRIVYLFRDLVAAASAAHVSIRLEDAERLKAYGHGWRNGVIDAQTWRADEGVLLVDLEAIERREPAVLDALARFTGVSELRLAAFTRARAAERRATLQEDELEVLEQAVRPAVQPSAGRGELAPWPRALLG